MTKSLPPDLAELILKVSSILVEAIYREADHAEDTRIEEKRLHTGQEYKILHTMNNIHKNGINIH